MEKQIKLKNNKIKIIQFKWWYRNNYLSLKIYGLDVASLFSCFWKNCIDLGCWEIIVNQIKENSFDSETNITVKWDSAITLYSSFQGLNFLLGSGSQCPVCNLPGDRQSNGHNKGRDGDSGQGWGTAQGKASHGHQGTGELRPDISQVRSVRSNALKVGFMTNFC